MRRDLEALQEFYRNQNNQLVELETRNRSKDLEEIGDVADAALWGALIPYYSGSIILHYIFSIETFSPRLNGFLWIFLWSIIAIFGLHLNSLKTKRRQKSTTYINKQQLIWFLLVIVAALSLAMVVSSNLPMKHEIPAVVVTDEHGRTLEDVLKQIVQPLRHTLPTPPARN